MMKLSRTAMRIFLLAVALIAAFSARATAPAVDPPFPAWVFGHVVWEDESTTQGTYDLVQGYLEHGIPVDGVIIDSPWATAYNTFEPDPELYPNMDQLIADLRRNRVHVVLWVTSVINLDDPDYQYCLDQGYFVKGMEELTWWKGPGGWIDYDNPEAVAFWHNRIDRAIEMGVDAWKCDGTEPWVLLKGYPAFRRYADNYYSDFYHYTRRQTGEKSLVMARPTEQLVNESLLNLPAWTNPLGLGLWLTYAPREVSYMSWVGDQDPTFDGLALAIRMVLRSSKKNYLIVGSDIGGYREGGPDKEVLIRWAQFGALTGFMENGGIGEHRPWMFDEETMKIYRAYVLLHKILEPYLYTQAVKAWQNGKSLIHPLPRGKDHYLLGPDILVAPISKPGGKVRVVLPRGQDWMPLFRSTDLLEAAQKCRIPDTEPALLRGACSFTYAYALHEFPVFLRAGAAIPVRTEPFGRELFGNAQGVTAAERLLLLVPTAERGKLPLRQTVFEEGRDPLALNLDLDLNAEFPVALDRGWIILPPPPEFPVIPDQVPPIKWRD